MSGIELTPFQKRVVSEIVQFCQDLDKHVLKLGTPPQSPGFSLAIVNAIVSLPVEKVRPRVALLVRNKRIGNCYLDLFHKMENSIEGWPEIWTCGVFSEVFPIIEIAVVAEANQLDPKLIEFLQRSTKKLILCYRTSEIPFAEAPLATFVYHGSSTGARTPPPTSSSNKSQHLVEGPSEK
jgi:hypothetical protein